jgi:hypothetical protein
VYFRKGTPGPPYDLAGNLALADLINDDAPLFVVSGLEKGFKYYFSVTAYDTAGNESTFSSAVCADVGDTITPCAAAPPGGGSVSGGGGSGGGGGGGGCFIETASDHQNKPLIVMVTLSFLVTISFIRFYFVFLFGRGIYAGDR